MYKRQISVSSPSLLINDLALISSLKWQEAFFSLVKTSSILFLSQSISDSAVCSSLNQILIVALASSGITLCAELPTSNVGTCIELGRKYSFPLSSGVARILVNNLDK